MRRPTADELFGALALAGERNRQLFPDLFLKVDQTLASDARPTQHIADFDYTGTVAECRWCGDDFPTSDDERYCTPACCDAHKDWLHRRQRRWCRRCGEWIEVRGRLYCNWQCRQEHERFMRHQRDRVNDAVARRLATGRSAPPRRDRPRARRAATSAGARQPSVR